ncbi:MAG: hypothetical protein OEY59_08560 [Deltaproteobacteria bacterium]|nr:hypothetical protein [Deltaproteobacteria bacterium]
MKSIKFALIVILAFNGLLAVYNWVSKEDATADNYQIEESFNEQPPEEASEGLSLVALTALTKEVRSGQELERRLNEKDSINNLDLNLDEKVDYIFIKEFGDTENKIGYSLTVQPQKDQEQEIAAVTVEKNGDRAEIQVVGNEQVYGENQIFNDWAPVKRDPSEAKSTASGNQPVYNSYFMPRPLFFSPWAFGFYPAYYSFFPIMPMGMYSSRISSYNTAGVNRGTNSYQKTSNKSITNPNQGKTAGKGINRSLRKPTATQKQFQTQNRSKVRSGGFGRSKSGNSLSKNSSTRARSSTTSPDRLRKSRTPGFGSRNSSFNSSRSSSTGGYFGRNQFRSSGYGSRSFGFGGK